VNLSLNYSFEMQIGFSPRSKVEDDLKFPNETMKCETKEQMYFVRQPELYLVV